MPQITHIIKYEGDNNTFIWKHPCEDFNTQTQLIVHESQQAVFYMNGQILDVFEAGRHTLNTENIPLIGKYFNKIFKGDTPFHCEVYFINKTEQMAIRWGTESKIEYIEPIYNFPVQIGANGEMCLRVINGEKLLIKLVGTENSFTQDDITQKFRAFLTMKLKTYLSSYICENRINIFQIDERLEEISNTLHKTLTCDFKEYGLSLVHFFVSTIIKPENECTYKRFKVLYFRQYADIAEAKLKQNIDIIEQETKKQKMILEAQGIAAKRQIEGYTYEQERKFDVAEGFSQNEGSGNLTNLGVGLGIMGGIGETVGNIVNKSLPENRNFSQLNTTHEICPNCNNVIYGGSKFCSYCGTMVKSEKAVCPHCKSETPTGNFCVICGKKLEE